MVDLFAAPAAADAADAAAGPSRAEAALAAIDPDQLAPREALEALYRLKALLPREWGGGRGQVKTRHCGASLIAQPPESSQQKPPTEARTTMTYCIQESGSTPASVFLSDSRTNAGLDQISIFRKMIVYERPGDRFMVLLSAGNLSISQSVREILQVQTLPNPDEGRTPSRSRSGTRPACSTPRAVRGAAVRAVYEQDGREALHEQNGMDFVASFIFGGQIRGEAMRLFIVYSAGNFIEATRETCFFQIGESKYGKPILDRVLTPATPLEEAAKCALVSMDSTLKSNLSVGLPLDIALYEADRLESDQITCIDEQNPYFRMVREGWGKRVRDIFEEMEDPHWGSDAEGAAHPLIVPTSRHDALKKIHNSNEKVV